MANKRSNENGCTGGIVKQDVAQVSPRTRVLEFRFLENAGMGLCQGLARREHFRNPFRTS